MPVFSGDQNTADCPALQLISLDFCSTAQRRTPEHRPDAVRSLKIKHQALNLSVKLQCGAASRY